MKTFKYIFQLILISLVVTTVSCSRDFDEPPLTSPNYDGPPANKTIKEIKTEYKDVTAPTLIKGENVIKARVVANDVSGNIFKQIYFEDATGGLQFGVDQNSVYTSYGIGQEVFLNLEGLYILKYGDELQIGEDGARANRIPWDKFKKHVIVNGWPDPKAAVPTVVDLGNLKDDMVNTLVTLENIHFVNGGVNYFIDKNQEGTTEEMMKDANGKEIVLRTSSYATPLNGVKLPSGKGSITGVLGRHFGTWQFVVRDISDVGEFDGTPVTPPTPGDDEVFFETFGEGANKEKVGAYTGWAMKAPIVYSDASGNADVRELSKNSHLWIPANKAVSFKIEGINTKGQSNLSLTYKLAANLFAAGENADLSIVTVKINGETKTIASYPVSNEAGDHNKFHQIEIANFPIGENNTIEFIVPDTNTKGLRLDDIRIAKPGSGTVDPPVEPSKTVAFFEKFGEGANKEKVGAYTGWDMKAPIVYSDASGNGDIRELSKNSHLWMAANKETFLTISGIDTKGFTNLELTYELAANLFAAGENTDLNQVVVKINGTAKTVASKPVSNEAGDHNKFHTITIADFPIGDNITLEFQAPASIGKGMRLDNIKIAVKE